MPEITMPRLSDTMEEGTLARWLKKKGESVEKGEVLAEIETDKATMELEAYDSGVLREVLVEEGQTVPIGQAIAVVGDGGGKAEGVGREAQEGAQATEAAPESAAASTEAPEAEPDEQAAAKAQPPQPQREEQPRRPSAESLEEEQAEAASRAEVPTGDGQQVKASPMARALARDRGIDLQTLRGSGPGGRIIRADVEAAVAGDGRAAAPPAEAGPAEAPSDVRRPTPDDVEELPLTNIRRVVARRMVESVQSAPHFYLTNVIDAEALTKLRAELNERLAASGDETKLSVNDLLVKACATSLRAHPDVNVSFGGDKLLRHKRINVGIAVALEGGLIVPVVRDADRKSLGEISREAKSLIEKARSGKLSPAEYSGGTFTISNLGMLGIDHFTAVINPPEAAILAVGATTPEPVAQDGHVVVRQTIKLTLSIDHRALDGATAARFLQHLKQILEEPLRIVV
jgi:pyruvate dehydrogenase E2 component (dihydrolipoamide acetyltransferase)